MLELHDKNNFEIFGFYFGKKKELADAFTPYSTLEASIAAGSGAAAVKAAKVQQPAARLCAAGVAVAVAAAEWRERDRLQRAVHDV